MPPKREKYVRKQPKEHVLARPDTYIGSIRDRVIDEYTSSLEDFTLSKNSVSFSPGILRIFVEILSNAIDNVERSRQHGTNCTKIMVNVDKETGETSVWNDGMVIPIVINEENKCYNHSLIFGELFTGSNFDDEQERVISGRNGIGATACVIFSKKFWVEGVDPEHGKILTQEWTNNSFTTKGPEIKNSKLKKGYTKVSWIPDFEKFNITGYTDDIVSVYKRYVIDAAMLTKLNVYFNDELIPCKSLKEYVNLYENDADEKERLYIKTTDCEVLLMPNQGFEAISFVNGVYTRLGGKHVDSWSEALFRPIVEKFNTKGAKTPKININDVKQFFRLFVVATVVRPEFESQSKNKLESPDVPTEVKPANINAIKKWSVMQEIENIIKIKELSVLKKTEKGKKNRIIIDNFDDAINAGGKHSADCSLILCEGLSAKTYAVVGIQKELYGKSGRDWYGILPLRGKFLNVRNSKPQTIADNKIVASLIQALGIRHGVDYTDDNNFKTLRYGKVISLTDADCDGIHIEGLILNFFHSLFPSLLQRKEKFVVSMKTPIVRVFRPKMQDLLFYDERKFKEFSSKQKNKINAKYYKGLGTTKASDVPDTFGEKMIEFNSDEHLSENMNKVFHAKYSNIRKQWLEEYDPKSESIISLDDGGISVDMNISDFLNNEMIKFSIDDCKRSIPNCIDGLKESQRKIIYAAMKRKLKFSGQEIKVAQFGAYAAEHSSYHHGEANLYGTIVNMAQDYVGSNNIPLFYRGGMFGTRLENGDDAADPRYIFTKFDKLTEYIFRQEDTPLLEQVNEDGDLVQPHYYVPIIPMILVNGSGGIGTGWSSDIPCYDPLVLVEGIHTWLDNDGEVLIEEPDTNSTISLFPEFIPHYKGFKGEIVNDNNKRFITYGIITPSEKNTFTVSELPIGMSNTKFKEICDDLLCPPEPKTKGKKKVQPSLKKADMYSTPNNINFKLTPINDFECNITNLKLYSYLSTTNMVLFDDKEKLKKYDSVDKILENFCIVRYDYYVKRKIYILKDLENSMKQLKNKVRFITDVNSKKLNIVNTSHSDIVSALTESGYDKKEDDTDDYGYLLRMQISSLTKEKAAQLKHEFDQEMKKYNTIKETSEKDMWKMELQEFVTNYKQWLVDNEKEQEIKINQKSKKTTKKK